MDRLFLDANVLWSAAYNPGSRIASLWRIKHVTLITSHFAAEEAKRNIDDADQRERLRRLLLPMVLTDYAVSTLPPGVTIVEKDQPILMAALASRATHLLTGDKDHFQLFGRTVGGVLILRPGDYLAMRD